MSSALLGFLSGPAEVTSSSPSAQLIRKRLPQASSPRTLRLKSCSSCRLLNVGQPSACWARKALAAVWICAASARDDVCPSRALPRLPSHQTHEALAPRPSTASAAAIGVTPRERERERAWVMVDSMQLASDVPVRATRDSAENARPTWATQRAVAVKLTREQAAYIRLLSNWQSVVRRLHRSSRRAQPIAFSRSRSAGAMAAAREDLARVQQILRIEDALQIALQRDELR
jgi:hypothetical protein